MVCCDGRVSKPRVCTHLQACSSRRRRVVLFLHHPFLSTVELYQGYQEKLFLLGGSARHQYMRVRDELLPRLHFSSCPPTLFLRDLALSTSDLHDRHHLRKSVARL